MQITFQSKCQGSSKLGNVAIDAITIDKDLPPIEGQIVTLAESGSKERKI